MMKSQLTVRLFSRKTNRHVSPISHREQKLSLNSRASWYDTFRHAVNWAESLVDDARADSTRGGGFWTSTHLVTLNIQVEGPPAIGVVEHVISSELNGSGLSLLSRYFDRFARQCELKLRVPPIRRRGPFFSDEFLKELYAAQLAEQRKIGDAINGALNALIEYSAKLDPAVSLSSKESE